MEKGNKLCLYSDSVEELQPVANWRLNRVTIEKYRQAGIDNISILIRKNDRTNFEEIVLNALLIFSKASLTSDPIEKTIYTITAIESILLKNNTESIQQNLSERLAIVQGGSLEERKRIINNIKTIYKFRSSYIHHGEIKSDLYEVEFFMNESWKFIISIFSYLARFKTKEEFINWIDDRKLSA